MIIVFLVASIITVLGTVITVSVPSYDSIGTMFEYFNTIIDYGINLYRYFIPPYGQSLLAVIIVMNTLYFLYKFVMWILHKIPLINIGSDD